MSDIAGQAPQFDAEGYGKQCPPELAMDYFDAAARTADRLGGPDALDAAADIVLRFLEGGYKAFDPAKGSVGGLAAVSTQNRLQDYRRREKLQRDRSTPIDAMEHPETLGFLASPSAAPDGVSVDLAAALRELSPDHRAVVELYYLGLSEREMAERLDVAPGTIKSRLNRGFAKLRPMLDGQA